MEKNNPRQPKKSNGKGALAFVLPYLIMLGLIVGMILALDGFGSVEKRTYSVRGYFDEIAANPSTIEQVSITQRETVIEINGIFHEGETRVEFSVLAPSVYAEEVFASVYNLDASKVKINNAFETSLLGSIAMYLIPSLLISGLI